MIPQQFDYSAPETLEEALRLVGGGAKALAGGMSLLPLMKLRLAAPERVVDLRRVPGLSYIAEANGSIRIGAMTTHYDIESSPLVRAHAPLLAETAGAIGDVQVRNAGTIGGSVAHADPASDYPAALLASGAEVRLVSSSGRRAVAYGDFLVDAFTTVLDPGEIIEEVVVPAAAAGTGWAYEKMLQPASGFAIVGVAACIARTAGKVNFARVGVTGLSSKAYRATAVEEKLLGTAGSTDDIRNAAGAIADGIEANSDLHASAAYRKQMAKVYAARAIARAAQRAA